MALRLSVLLILLIEFTTVFAKAPVPKDVPDWQKDFKHALQTHSIVLPAADIETPADVDSLRKIAKGEVAMEILPSIQHFSPHYLFQIQNMSAPGGGVNIYELNENPIGFLRGFSRNSALAFSEKHIFWQSKIENGVGACRLDLRDLSGKCKAVSEKGIKLVSASTDGQNLMFVLADEGLIWNYGTGRITKFRTGGATAEWAPNDTIKIGTFVRTLAQLKTDESSGQK